MTSNSYHIPVLLHAAVKGLQLRSDGIYVDVTFGGGGHSREILSQLTNGKLIGFDQDADAQKNVPNDPRFVFVPKNFSELKSSLSDLGINQVQGILADLGVSSHQFDNPDRGFSIRYDSKLDMRMDTSQSLSAQDVINEYDETELKFIFQQYGEVEQAGRLVKAISILRKEKRIETTGELLKLIERIAPRQKEKQYQAKVFQAIRIEVNRELDVLKDFLTDALSVLSPGGRLVVISYHSLEDRLVKNFIRSGNFKGELEKDFYGNPLKPFNEVFRKPLIPDAAEIELNPRARSAKLRVAEKIE